MVSVCPISTRNARPRGSFGSRGTRTFSAPAPTATAPNAASPITRSMTQPGQPGTTSAARAQPLIAPEISQTQVPLTRSTV